ncbi:MAG: hypothetical protein QNJ18_24045, partial [Xenococcaceae cyanobacterium MO_167.B52]|nr:hypothetical protein [Xenococcaceae cyanobacterium MO_167.B52]
MIISNNPNTSNFGSELATFSEHYGLDSLPSENGFQGATIITVDTIQDIVADDNLTSLREAIDYANSTDNDVFIHLSKGTYTLTIVGSDEENNATGDLDILGVGQVFIVGIDGSEDTLIQAEELEERVFDIKQNAHVKITNLTITGGDETEGGAIYNNGTLTVRDSKFENNSVVGVYTDTEAYNSYGG